MSQPGCLAPISGSQSAWKSVAEKGNRRKAACREKKGDDLKVYKPLKSYAESINQNNFAKIAVRS